MLDEDFGMKIDMEKVNKTGLSIALGYPVGCSGLRIIVTLFHELKRQGKRLGGVSLCLGDRLSVNSLWSMDV